MLVLLIYNVTAARYNWNLLSNTYPDQFASIHQSSERLRSTDRKLERINLSLFQCVNRSHHRNRFIFHLSLWLFLPSILIRSVCPHFCTFRISTHEENAEFGSYKIDLYSAYFLGLFFSVSLTQEWYNITAVLIYCEASWTPLSILAVSWRKGQFPLSLSLLDGHSCPGFASRG